MFLIFLKHYEEDQFSDKGSVVNKIIAIIRVLFPDAAVYHCQSCFLGS